MLLVYLLVFFVSELVFQTTVEARLLFDMLDADNSGEIQFTEFLSGCMRLQGPAKAIDMVLVMRELREAIAVASPVAQATPPVVAPIP